eukprot:m.57813 g.57813  ORF g.57813 m.57813 type:complete len:164 (-) comp15622_c0_seq5:1504-1995(-)
MQKKNTLHTPCSIPPSAKSHVAADQIVLHSIVFGNSTDSLFAATKHIASMLHAARYFNVAMMHDCVTQLIEYTLSIIEGVPIGIFPYCGPCTMASPLGYTAAPIPRAAPVMTHQKILDEAMGCPTMFLWYRGSRNTCDPGYPRVSRLTLLCVDHMDDAIVCSC